MRGWRGPNFVWAFRRLAVELCWSFHASAMRVYLLSALRRCALDLSRSFQFRNCQDGGNGDALFCGQHREVVRTVLVMGILKRCICHRCALTGTALKLLRANERIVRIPANTS